MRAPLPSDLRVPTASPHRHRHQRPRPKGAQFLRRPAKRLPSGTSVQKTRCCRGGRTARACCRGGRTARAWPRFRRCPATRCCRGGRAARACCKDCPSLAPVQKTPCDALLPSREDCPSLLPRSKDSPGMVPVQKTPCDALLPCRKDCPSLVPVILPICREMPMDASSRKIAVTFFRVCILLDLVGLATRTPYRRRIVRAASRTKSN